MFPQRVTRIIVSCAELFPRRITNNYVQSQTLLWNVLLFVLICFSWYFVGTAGIFSIFSIIFITESRLASHCPPVSKSVSGWFLSDKSSDFHWTSEQHHDAAAASCIVSVFLLVPDLEICITWNHLSIYTWLGWVTRLLMQGWVNCAKKLGVGWLCKEILGRAGCMYAESREILGRGPLYRETSVLVWMGISITLQ